VDLVSISELSVSQFESNLISSRLLNDFLVSRLTESCQRLLLPLFQRDSPLLFLSQLTAAALGVLKLCGTLLLVMIVWVAVTLVVGAFPGLNLTTEAMPLRHASWCLISLIKVPVAQCVIQKHVMVHQSPRGVQPYHQRQNLLGSRRHNRQATLQREARHLYHRMSRQASLLSNLLRNPQ
jgi:hypothetical protein